MEQKILDVDVLILGCGIAGSSTAIEIARLHPQAHVMMLTRASDGNESNTRYAQGGIVATSDDYIVDDILNSADGLGNPDAARVVALEGPSLVKKMLVDTAQVSFDQNSEHELALALEGGHRLPRVAKVADYTGKSIQEHLTDVVKHTKNIELICGVTAVDMLMNEDMCSGASVFDQSDNRVSHIVAKKTVLATGGASFLFAHTTNPSGARGDGIAMAYRAGATLAGMEFEQFHPTALSLSGAPAFLISEAVRGLGARLTDDVGRPFMQRYYPDLEKPDLATRDKVSRAIYMEMQKTGASHVYLDLHSYISNVDILSHFPVIANTCLSYGVDITNELVPVSPAAHYFCGGVVTDLYGRTSIQNLYAVGEVASTGLHGANRLASTSLLEGVVFGMRAAQDMDISGDRVVTPTRTIPTNYHTTQSNQAHTYALYMEQIQRILWEYVGVVRTTTSLVRAVAELTTLKDTIDSVWEDTTITDALIGIRNGICTALLIAKNALANTSSIGCHWRISESYENN